VTGLVVVETQEHWSLLGEVVILLLIQLGGLGFTVGASLLLLTIGGGGHLRTALLANEGAPYQSLTEIIAISRRIVRFVLVTEGIGAVVLTFLFLPHQPAASAAWHGLFHAVSAFCNAGFDLQGGYRSMTGYQESAGMNLALIALIQAGSLSYIVLSDAWTKRSWRQMTVDTRLVLVTNAVLVVVGTIAFLVVEWNAALGEAPTVTKPLTALFHSISTRTAGFASVNLGDLEPATLLLWMGLMLIGGASGSTAGGVKLTTIAIVIVAIMSTLRSDPETHLFRRRIAASQVFLAMGIIALFVFAHFLLTLLLTYTEAVSGAGDKPFIDLMFETMSAAATVGLSTGITPEMSDPGKLILCLAMFFGRLGPLTLAYAVTQRQQPARYRYPQVRVRIG
jgi:trk system potassium uptake protein TrkH